MRLYALLLLLYPREIRDRFGAGMRYAFRRDSDAARAQGLGARLAFWLTTLVESVRFGLAERLESRPHPQKQEGTEMTSAWTIDWRDAWRALRATPLVTALAVLSLALGIGANTALFSILNSLLLKPLPVAEPERLVLLDGDSWTNPIWEEIRARQDQVADGGFAWSNERFDLSSSGETDRIDGIYASGRIFEILGVPAARGRTFTVEDDVRGGGPDGIDIGIRSAGGAPLALTRSVAAALGQVDREAALTFYSLADQVTASLTQDRILAAMSSFFGGLALLLASLGLYGVTSYSVSQRRTEIGIRMALGADGAGVVRMVMMRVGGLVGIGIAIGTAASVWASQFVTALLYGFKPWDPLPFATAALVLTLVAGVAGWLPARRASRINPTILLREG